MSKEYWVNVDRSEHLYWYSNQHISSYWLKAPWARVKYRLHITMKDKPGLKHHCPLKMVDGMVTLNALPKYENNLSYEIWNWMD